MGYLRQYQHWHNDSDEYFEKMVRSRKNQISQILGEVRKDVRILEIGCGMGFTLAALVQLGYTQVKGVDSDEGQVEKCKFRNLPVDLVDGKGEWLKGCVDTFDYIFAFDVLEHVPTDALIAFCGLICTKLDTNGVFIGTVPNAHSNFAATYRWIDWTHFCSFTPSSIDYVLWHGGFKEIEITASETIPKYYMLPRPIVILWWLKLLLRWPRRFAAYLEMGWHGWQMPLSLNLLFKAKR